MVALAHRGKKLEKKVADQSQHCTYYVVETDDINKLNGFLEPALGWAKCEITPVRDMTKD